MSSIIIINPNDQSIDKIKEMIAKGIETGYVYRIDKNPTEIILNPSEKTLEKAKQIMYENKHNNPVSPNKTSSCITYKTNKIKSIIINFR